MMQEKLAKVGDLVTVDPGQYLLDWDERPGPAFLLVKQEHLAVIVGERQEKKLVQLSDHEHNRVFVNSSALHCVETGENDGQ